VDLDEILYGDGGIEYFLLQACVGKVGILVLPRISYFILSFDDHCLVCLLDPVPVVVAAHAH
jgi:hypothetical protein